MGDINAIYLSATGGYNLVRRNYLHDIAGPACHSVIRTDAYEKNNTFTENILHNIEGCGFTLKYDNVISNNIICNVTEGPILNNYISVRAGPCDKAVVSNNIYYYKAEQDPEYYSAGNIRKGADLSEPSFENNIFWDVCQPDRAERYLKMIQDSLNTDLSSMAVDPLFIDMGNGDFRLKENSPALKLGIKPIENCGPTGPVGPVLNREMK